MTFPDAQELEIRHLSRLFDNMSECYKLFWFQAIVDFVSAGKTTLTYDELIDEMVADAWYMVSEYRLNLGPSDTLEALIHYVHQTSGIKSSEKKEKIIQYLQNSDDKELKRKKRTLSLNVPYRLQSPFLENMTSKDWNVSEKKLAEEINRQERLIYYFKEIFGLQSKIEIQPEWRDYIIKHQEILRGWIQCNMITYLQRRNPNVPGIVNKLNPPQERKLDKAKRYWKMIAEETSLCDIYTNEILNPKEISIDHFVPWSYVAHDELWNLNPTTKSANSSKSNQLPSWDVYFPQLCRIEFLSYRMIWDNKKVYGEFEKCAKEHVNSDDVRFKLYRRGLRREEFFQNLEEIILPVYQSAHNMGFGNWRYQKSL